MRGTSAGLTARDASNRAGTAHAPAGVGRGPRAHDGRLRASTRRKAEHPLDIRQQVAQRRVSRDSLSNFAVEACHGVDVEADRQIHRAGVEPNGCVMGLAGEHESVLVHVTNGVKLLLGQRDGIACAVDSGVDSGTIRTSIRPVSPVATTISSVC